MKTFQIKSAFGILNCTLRTPENVRIVLPSETPALIRGVSMDFNVELNKKDGKWIDGFSMCRCTDSRKDVTPTSRKLIISKVLVIWTTYFEDNPLLQMQAMLDAERNSISNLEYVIQKERDLIASYEIHLAQMKVEISQHEQEIKNIKRSFQTKDSLTN